MKPIWLFCPASPGMRVLVFRNWLQSILYSKDFATLSESIWYSKYCNVIEI